MKQVKIYLDDDRKRWVSVYAKRKGMSTSQLIRQMIDLYKEVLTSED